MFTKHIAAGIAGSLLLASAAFAAENSTSTYQGDWRTSKVVGLNVYNDQNQNVGSINDLLTDKSGNIKAAVLSVGGFLGMGSRYVAIPFEKLKFSERPVPSTSTGASNAPAKPSSGTTTGSASNQSVASSKPNPWYPDHATFNATKDELQAMPEFKYTTE
jgi:sporulation protein YlmC with PRC-barrel domain